jgi:O-antigen/teichoic acid export membrane protein
VQHPRGWAPGKASDFRTGFRRHRFLVAGLVDTASASLASLLVGLSAVRVLDPALLGVYALVFGAFNLVAVIPYQLVFAPLEIAAVDYPQEHRLTILRKSLRLGAVSALLTSLLLVLWVYVVPPGTPRDALLGLTVTSLVCAFLSPMQDHLRRMQHLAGRSAAAAAISTVQLTVAIGALFGFSWLHVAPWWIPLGSLAVANFVSGAFGVLISTRWLQTEWTGTALGWRQTLNSGKWLLLGGLTSPAAAFLAGALIVHLSSTEALGYAEAARIVGQPILVLALGLSATLGPRSMEAARAHRAESARKVEVQFVLLTSVVAGMYALLFGISWSWNPLVTLVPNAFKIPALLLAVLLSTTLNGILFPIRSELVGGRRERDVAYAESLGSLLRIGVGGTAGITGSFAMPLGFIALGITRWAMYRRALHSYYADTVVVVSPSTRRKAIFP